MEQNKYGFRHLSALRKVLMAKKSGVVSFSTAKQQGEISIHQGNIIVNKQTIEDLTQFLELPTYDVQWQAKNTSGQREEDAVSVLSKVMNQVQWSPQVGQALKRVFLKLPPVYVRMLPLHRYGYKDGLTYLALVQQALKKTDFTPADFIQGVYDESIIQRRLRVLMLGYCLGLMTTAPKHKVSEKKDSSSIALRILQRIRGM